MKLNTLALATIALSIVATPIALAGEEGPQHIEFQRPVQAMVPVTDPTTIGVPTASSTRKGFGVFTLGTRTPGVAYASSSLQCGKTVYEVSTGNDDGDCKPAYNEKTGEKWGTTCMDDKGNFAHVSCAGGCGQTKGAGSCEIKQTS